MVNLINKSTMTIHGSHFVEPNSYPNESNINYLLNIDSISKTIKFDDIYSFKMKFCSGDSDFIGCQQWFETNVVPEYLILE